MIGKYASKKTVAPGLAADPVDPAVAALGFAGQDQEPARAGRLPLGPADLGETVERQRRRRDRLLRCGGGGGRGKAKVQGKVFGFFKKNLSIFHSILAYYWRHSHESVCVVLIRKTHLPLSNKKIFSGFLRWISAKKNIRALRERRCIF